MTAPKNPNRALVVALLTAALTQETVLLATMQAALQALAAVESAPHTPDEQELDYDNLPV